MKKRGRIGESVLGRSFSGKECGGVRFLGVEKGKMEKDGKRFNYKEATRKKKRKACRGKGLCAVTKAIPRSVIALLHNVKKNGGEIMDSASLVTRDLAR